MAQVGFGADPRGVGTLPAAGACVFCPLRPRLQVSPEPLELSMCVLCSHLIMRPSLPWEALTAFNLGRTSVLLSPAAWPGRPGMGETSTCSSSHMRPGWRKPFCSSHEETEAWGQMWLEVS